MSKACIDTCLSRDHKDLNPFSASESLIQKGCILFERCTMLVQDAATSVPTMSTSVCQTVVLSSIPSREESDRFTRRRLP